MSWLLFKTTLKKCYIWLKEYWQIPFMILWTVLVYVMTRRNTDALMEVIETRKESYKKQIEVLKKSHYDELLKRDELLLLYQDAIKKIEDDYRLKKIELTKSQKNEIKKIVVKSKGNPDEIKKKIQDQFGFTLV